MQRFTSVLSFVITFTFLSLSLTSGYAQSRLERVVETDTLRVGMSLDQPPFCMKDKDGKPEGFDVELAELLAKSMGVELKIVETKFPDLIKGLDDSLFDVVISGLTITPKRNIDAFFTSPYVYSGKAVLAYKNKFATQNKKKLNDESVTLVALANSTSENYVKHYLPKAKTIYVATYKEAIAMMQTNKADALVTDRNVIEVLDELYPKEKFKYSEDDMLTVEPIGMAVAKHEAQFANLLNNYIETLKNLGYLEALEEKWFALDEWVKFIED